MDEWLATSLENLYNGNIAVCARQGVSRAECEKRIEWILKEIQKKTEKVCWKDEACNMRWLEWHIDHEEIEKLKAKILLIYT